VLRQGVIEAQVRWYSSGKAGLVFEPERPAEKAEQHRERKSNRVAFYADVSMRRLGKVTYSVRVFDASPHGCRIQFVERPQVGEIVRVKFGDVHALDARVCWVEGYCAGLEFKRAFHPAVFDLLVDRMVAALEAAA